MFQSMFPSSSAWNSQDFCDGTGTHVMPEQRVTNKLWFSPLFLPSLKLRFRNVFLLFLLLWKDNFSYNNCKCIHLKPYRYCTLNPKGKISSVITFSINPHKSNPLHYISPYINELLENVSEIQVPMLCIAKCDKCLRMTKQVFNTFERWRGLYRL